MFIKKEEKERIFEQINELEELNSKQSETIDELKNQNAILIETQEKQREAFDLHMSELTKINDSQANTIDELKNQNSLILEKQERQELSFNNQLSVLEEAKNQQTTLLKILSEQNAELQKTNKSMIEQRDKSEAVLIEAVGKIADVKEYRTTVYTPEQKEKAAYALNLCMVSISQIVDYNDLYILDQEYDMVLNNLNLENMPKDEALLKILKQTLDTITYFKIQEGDKKFIEKEYQHNIKNAIWGAVPRNLNILTCGDMPWALAVSAGVSIICQVGTGFMNYHRNKAEYNIKRDKQAWQLQRSAMEQFNGLRRDLFDTAWRLADEYKFADELRLTERQIDLYDEILNDQDDMRRYERLDIIKDAFEAYPPFWFFIGDAAAKIVTNKDVDVETAAKYKALAITNFEKFISKSKLNLLREDTLLATCALEYIDILDSQNDKEKIYELLELANKNSGNENDIIELIGLAYMKMNDFDKSSYAFRRLINEGYNIGINVQLLSSLYVQEYINSSTDAEKNKIKELYSTLLSRTQGHDTFRLSENDNEDWNTINSAFLSVQQDRIIDQFNNMIEQLDTKYNIAFNKLLPLDLKRNREFSDNWYKDDDETMVEKRYNEISKIIRKENLFLTYCLLYSEENYSDSVLDLFGELITCVNTYLSDITSLEYNTENALTADNSNIKYDLADYLKDELRRHSPAIRHLDTCFEKKNPTDQFMAAVKELRFINICDNYFNELSRRGEENIRKITNMSDLFTVESSIRSLCINQNIRIRNQMKVEAEEENGYVIPLEVIYGDVAQNKIDYKVSVANKRSEVINAIKDYEKVVIRDPSETRILIDKESINAYVNKSRNVKRLSRIDIIAIVDDASKKNMDLIFTFDGISILEKDHDYALGEVFKYKDTLYNKTDTITFVRKRTVTHRTNYINSAVNVGKMYEMIMEISALLIK